MFPGGRERVHWERMSQTVCEWNGENNKEQITFTIVGILYPNCFIKIKIYKKKIANKLAIGLCLVSKMYLIISVTSFYYF